MTVLLIRNIRPLGGASVDVLMVQGRIAALGPALAAPADVLQEDGAGALLLPGLVEGHAHLDKTTWGGPWYRNTVGLTRMHRIDNERAWRGASGHDPDARSLALAQAYLANGTTRMRSHADIDPDVGLAHVLATLRTAALLAPVLEIQVVAFPQSGVVRCPGVAELMDAALAEGAHVVGGIDPCQIDRDPVAQLDVLFGLAEKHGKPLDIHLHEPGEMGAFSLDLILERTEALGLHGQVTISHGFCLGMIGAAERDALLARMARMDVRTPLPHRRRAPCRRWRSVGPRALRSTAAMTGSATAGRRMRARTCSTVRCISGCAMRCAVTMNWTWRWTASLMPPRMAADLPIMA